MTYQLVLQWPFSGMDVYDAVIEIEDQLIESLGDEVDVDGHDVGAGEMNIFIWTNDPGATFDAAQNELASNPLWASVRAGFREESADRYTAIWPPGEDEFSVA